MVTNEVIDVEALYANIDRRIKDRAIVYITESKVSGKEKTSSLKGLIEEALDCYMINNPIIQKP